MNNKWIGWVRTKSNRIESAEFTTLNDCLSDATSEVTSRTGAQSVTLYKAPGSAPSGLVSVASGAGTAFTSSDFGWLIIGGIAIVFWPITVTVLTIWLIKYLWGRPFHTVIPAVIVSYLPWSIKRPLRRRYKWLN